MTPRVPKVFWIWVSAAIAMGMIVCGLAGHLLGVEGFALGILGSMFNLGALWLIISVVTGLLNATHPERKGTVLVVVAFLVKVPLFLGMSVLAHRIGGPSLGCFLAGVALVYFGLVGWMLAGR